MKTLPYFLAVVLTLLLNSPLPASAKTTLGLFSPDTAVYTSGRPVSCDYGMFYYNTTYVRWPWDCYTISYQDAGYTYSVSTFDACSFLQTATYTLDASTYPATLVFLGCY